MWGVGSGVRRLQRTTSAARQTHRLLALALRGAIGSDEWSDHEGSLLACDRQRREDRILFGDREEPEDLSQGGDRLGTELGSATFS